MISVIIPFWNSAPFLDRCAKSLTNQKGDFEFIFVNDKSTDGGECVLQPYIEADKRFVLIDNKRGKGVSGARNTGLDVAKGEYVTFLDADDEFLPDAYKAFAKTIAKADANIYQLNHMRYYTAKDKYSMKYWNEGGWYGTTAMPECWYGVWNKLYRADFVKDIRFLEGLQYGEDGLFVLECLAKDDHIYHMPKNLVVLKHRFDNKGSLSRIKTFDDILVQIRAYEDFLFRQTDQNLKRTVCEEIGKLWAVKMKKIV